MQNLLHNLNPEQLAAVTLPAQSALILAGAGSGKTRVLTTRIAWLIQTGQVSPSGILAVTFTNKAAKEMTARLSAMLPINTRGMWIGTFHGLCNRLLRTHYRDAALPQTFQILDTQDQLSVIKRLLKANNVDDEKFPPKELMYFINGAKDQGLRADKIEPYNADERKKVELYQLYDDQCQREGVVDFAELLLRTFELLSRNQPLARALPAALPAHPRRRVPGYQRPAIQLAEADGGPWPAWRRAVRRRRRRPEHLRLPRRQRRQHERLRTRVQGAEPDQAGTELPLARPHPRCRQCADRE